MNLYRHANSWIWKFARRPSKVKLGRKQREKQSVCSGNSGASIGGKVVKYRWMSGQSYLAMSLLCNCAIIALAEWFSLFVRKSHPRADGNKQHKVIAGKFRHSPSPSFVTTHVSLLAQSAILLRHSAVAALFCFLSYLLFFWLRLNLVSVTRT